ncbi:MAG: hypothetical protein ACLPKW_04035 [Acetobacteraceae bacterium]
MLGAQILLGFQFNGAFQTRLDALSPPAMIVDAIALLLMLSSVGLLIAPFPPHCRSRGKHWPNACRHIALRRSEPAAVRRGARDRPCPRAAAHRTKCCFLYCRRSQLRVDGRSSMVWIGLDHEEPPRSNGGVASQ